MLASRSFAQPSTFSSQSRFQPALTGGIDEASNCSRTSSPEPMITKRSSTSDEQLANVAVARVHARASDSRSRTAYEVS